MISEGTQEQAALYALGLLDADEAAAFEQAQDADAELRALSGELRETAAALALSTAGHPPPGLKARVLAQLAGEEKRGLAVGTAAAARDGNGPPPDKIVAGPWGRAALPWALAALLMVCCGVLAVSRERWRRGFSALERKALAVEVATTHLRQATPALTPAPATPEVDALRQVAFCPLEPTAEEAARPRVAVLWDAARREGKLRVAKLPPPGAGKDYQLWVVEKDRKDAVSAGVVPVDAKGGVETDFQPVAEGGEGAAVAFALSLERAGGSPKNEGPILFLGKL